VIRPESVPKLMRVFSLSNQIDTELFSKEIGLNAYIVEPTPVVHSQEFGSDIQIKV
jgi:hypothetical protein